MAEPLISRQYRATLFKYRKFKQRLDRRLKNNTLAELSLHHRNRLLRTIERLRRQLAVLQERLKYTSAAIAMGAALAISTPALAQQPSPVGDEFLVNSFVTNYGSSAVAMDSDGDYVIAWMSYTQDGDSFGVYARRFNVSGQALGAEFKVNTYTIGAQDSPSVAMDADGDFVITWHSAGQDGNGKGIYAQRYDAAGVAQGGEFQVNTHTTSNQAYPSVAMDDDGDFIVTWAGLFQDGVDTGIYAQRFDASGVAQGAEFRVSALTGGLVQSTPSAAMDADGDFVVAWQALLIDGDNGSIVARRFNASGTGQGMEFVVNSYTTGNQSAPSVAMDAGGDFVITWQSEYQDGSYNGVYAQQYSAAGVAKGGEFKVNTYTTGSQEQPSVAMDDHGGFVISWHSSPGADENDYGVYAQRYGANRIPQGHEFRVNTFTTSNQDHPAIAMDADGNFAIAWTSHNQGASIAVYAKQYASQPPPAPIGSEFQVNTYTTSNQTDPAIAEDADGDYVITWQSDGQDGNSLGIYAQRYNGDGAPQGAEFRVNTYITGAQVMPSVAMDHDGNFVIAWSSNGQDGDAYGVYAQMYDAAGVAQGTEFQVNAFSTGSQNQASIAMDAVGNFVIAWSSGGDNWFQRYDAEGVAQGGQFLVNSTTGNTQDSPVVAMDDDGDFVIAWTSLAQDGSSYGVYARLYDAAGVGLTAELPVNTYTTSHQREPSIAMDADGDFVVTWSSYGQDGDLNGVYAQRFNSAGEAQGVEFRVNNYTTSHQRFSAVTMDDQGDFVIAWTSWQDANIYGVYARRYSSDGFAKGVEFLVNTTVGGLQWYPAVAMDSQGDMVATWHGLGSDGNSSGVYAQSYTSVPPPTATGPEFQVNTYTTTNQRNSSLAADASGDFVIAWQSNQDGDGFGIYAQRYDASGANVGGEFRVNTFTTLDQAMPVVAINADGDFVVAWNSVGQDGDSYGVYAQRYNAEGLSQGGEFQVNTYTTASQSRPSIDMDAAGNFVIAWSSWVQDGMQLGVYAQRFDATGAALGGEFRVNTHTALGQSAPSVAVDADGDFVIAWHSMDQDLSSYGIYAQRYDAAGVAQGSEFKVHTYTTGNQAFPSVAMDADGDFVVAWRSTGQDGGGYGVYAQRFNNAGTAQGGEFRVNTFTTGTQFNPSADMDSDGDFVITWLSGAQESSMSGIYAQRYHAAGNANGPEFHVNSFETGEQTSPSITLDADGDFVIAWNSTYQDGSNDGVYAQRFLTDDPHTPPTIETNTGLVLDEGATSQLTNAILKTTDAEEPAEEIVYTVLQLPVNGELSNNGTQLNLNETFTQADLDNNMVTYAHDGGETTTDEFHFVVADGTNFLAEEIFSITITPVSDAPVLQTNAGVTVTEGQGVAIDAAALNSTDIDNTDAEIIYQVTSLPLHGGLTKFGAPIGLNDTFAQEMIGFGAIEYVHDGSEASTDSFNFTVTDGTTGLSEATFDITVDPVNDTPVLAVNTGNTVNEGGEVIILSIQLSTSDDDNAASSIEYKVTVIPVKGQLQKNGATLLLNGTFTQADLNNNLISYVHNGGETISDSFKFTVTDGTTTLPETPFTITINPVNDPPILSVNEILDIDEGGVANIHDGVLFTDDVDGDLASIVYTVTGVPTHGFLDNNGSVIGLNGTFTQEDIANGWLAYIHDGSEPSSDSFTFTVTDGTATLGESTFNFAINNVSDPPNLSYLTLNVDEGSETVITSSVLSATDVDNAPGTIIYTITGLPSHGVLKNNSVGLSVSDTFTQSDINNNLIFFTHDAGETSTDSFTFAVSDGTTTSSESTFYITINAVNDPLTPSVNTGLNLNEDSWITITNGALLTEDVDNIISTIVYEVITLPAHGTLQKNSVVMSLNETFTQLDINNHAIYYEHDGSETSADSFTFTVTDGTTTLAADTFNFTINAVNDEPVLSVNATLTVNEGAEATISSLFLIITDADNAASTIIYTLEELPGFGDLKKSGIALSANDTFTQADINNGIISYASDGSEIDSDSFDFGISDGLTTLYETFSISISPVNDAPMLFNSGVTVSEGEDAFIAASNLTTVDFDNDATSIYYTVTELPQHGEIKLSGANISLNDTFTQDDINNSRVGYFHDGSESTSDSFTFTVTDGTAALAPAAFDIVVNPVSDAPVLAVNAGLTLDEGIEATITNALLSTTDIDNDAASITYFITQLPANGLLLKLGAVAGVNDTFTQSDIDAGAITFQHNGNENISDSFKFTVSDAVSTIPESTFNIDINPINDSPTLSTNAGLSVDEGGLATILDVITTDADNDASSIVYTVTLLPVHGQVLKVGVAVGLNGTFTQSDINSSLISYQHDGSETQFDFFNFSASDGMETTPEYGFGISITPTSDVPVVENNAGLTLDEGATAMIRSTLLDYTDIDNIPVELTYQITAAPSNGSLLKNAVVLTTGGTFTQLDVDNDIITYQHDGSETTSDSFDFTLFDGVNTLSGLSFEITINPVADVLTQTIDFAALSNKTDGDAAFAVSATASSTLPVTFSIVSGPATISGSTLTITGPGPITVRASQAGNSSFDPAVDVDQTFCANPKKATITVQDQGTAAPKLVSSASTGNQWFKATQQLGGQTNSILTVSEAGIYKVQVTVGGCVGAMSSDFALVITDIQPTLSSEIVLSPNPAADFVRVDGLSGGVSEATVTDMSGRKQHLPIQQEGTQLVLDARGLSRGTYLISITDGDKIHRLKFIKY